jgi:excisionase family DNA binding protein
MSGKQRKRGLPGEERWLSPEEAAREHGVSGRTIRNWIASGRLEARRAGRRWQVVASSSEKLFAQASEDRRAGSDGEAGRSNRLPPVPLPGAKSRDKARYTVQSLGAWRSCAEALAAAVAAPKEASPLVRRLAESSVRVFEELSAGYHSYLYRDKRDRYCAARDSLCAAAAVAEITGDRDLSLAIQGAPLSAMTALIRSMERKKAGRDG